MCNAAVEEGGTTEQTVIVTVQVWCRARVLQETAGLNPIIKRWSRLYRPIKGVIGDSKSGTLWPSGHRATRQELKSEVTTCTETTYGL